MHCRHGGAFIIGILISYFQWAATASPSRRLAGGFLSRESKLRFVESPAWGQKDLDELQWNYLAKEKLWPYVGSDIYTSQFPVGTRHYYNSLAVFTNQGKTRLHGTVGLSPNLTRMYKEKPRPPAVTDANRKEALKHGGFYLAYSDSLPLDRNPPDRRASVCKKVAYDLASLDDASIVITFFNEPISTLMRTVHSVLNLTPPPILREIILVDDYSNTTALMPGGFLDAYVKLLPKVKVLRLPERRGLVTARLLGAKVAQAPVLVVLDSHVEVNPGWLEPQLARLNESPVSIVFPQILGLNNEDFSFSQHEGIGCNVSFKWVMQEKSQGVITPSSPAALPSSSMAGGLFAVRLDWFWKLGGYDEEFSMWGAENVEMPFRTWMCGGRVECTPCALTYHIYRKGGAAYSYPPQALWRNRLRTARLWTDEFYSLASIFIGHADLDIGPVDRMLSLKKELHCKDFNWFLREVDHTQRIRNVSAIMFAGEIKNRKAPHMCIDTLSHHKAGETYGVFYCHGTGGTQGYLMSSDTFELNTFTDETLCLSPDITLQLCSKLDGHWNVTANGKLVWSKSGKCLTYVRKQDTNHIQMMPCKDGSTEQEWTMRKYVPTEFKPLDFSPEYKTAFSSK